MTTMPNTNLRFRRAARAVKGAIGRLLHKIVNVSPVGYDIPTNDWPKFPPY